MVDKKSEANNLGNHDIEDVRWLCSLSETELDMLIWIKRMALHRALMIGQKSLAKKFDLKTLRSLSSTMMENLRDQLKSHTSVAEVGQQLEESNLLRSPISATFSSMNSEELWAYIRPETKKRIADLCADDEVPRQKRRTVKEPF